MEILVITAVQSFKEDVKKIFKKCGVKVYSQTDVIGYKDLSDEPQDENWFGSDAGSHRSILFYAFVEEKYADGVLREIEELNKTQETHSYVHAAVLEIKKGV